MLHIKFMEIGPPEMDKKIFEGFIIIIWVWRQSLSYYMSIQATLVM